MEEVRFPDQQLVPSGNPGSKTSFNEPFAGPITEVSTISYTVELLNTFPTVGILPVFPLSTVMETKVPKKITHKVGRLDSETE